MDQNSDNEAADAVVPGGAPAVRAQLEQLCRSVDFVSSPRATEFLRYVVEESLAGRSAGLSQRAIAHGVYGRDGEFDPGVDPLVRMQAKRVRRALEHYYLTVGRGDAIVVRLPKGGYQPEFSANGHAERVPVREGGAPVLMVARFRNDTGNEEFEFIVRGLAGELVVELDRYQLAQVLLLPEPAGEGRGGLSAEAVRMCEGRCCFRLEGALTRKRGGLGVSVRLSDVSTGVLQWSHEGHGPTDGDERDRFLDQFVKQVAAAVAEEQGAVAHCVLEGVKDPFPRQATAFEALLLMYAVEGGGSRADFERAIVGLREAVEAAPEDGRLWSGLARLSTLNHGLELLPEHIVSMGEIIGYAETGVRLRGDDQRAWCILGFAHTIAGNLPTGREATLTALDRNPNSLFFRDVIGYLLTLQGDWERGPALSREAVALNPFVRPRVFCGLWLDAFRRESFDEALAWARRYMEPGVFWAPLMRAAADARLGDSGGAGEAVAELLGLKPDFRESGRRLIRHFVKGEDLTCQIEDALETAGVAFRDPDRD